MAWNQDYRDKYGVHHRVCYRVNGKVYSMDGGYTDSTNDMALKKAKQAELDSKSPEDTRGMPIALAIEKYIDNGVSNDDDESTTKLKKYLLSFFIEDYGSLGSTKNITLDIIAKYKLSLKKRFSDAGAQMKFKQFRAFLRFCFDRDWIDKPLADRVEGIGSKFQPHYLDTDEIKKLIANCVLTPDLPELVAIALGTGMRRGELFNMQAKHIVENGTFIFVPDEITKTDNGRFVPIMDHVAQIMNRRLELHKGKLFPGWANPNAMGSAFNRAVGRSAMGRVRFHDLRHTFAKMYLMRGGRINDLADIMGHTNIQTTREYYSKFPKTLLRDQYNSIKLDTIQVPSALLPQVDFKSPLKLPVDLPQNP